MTDRLFADCCYGSDAQHMEGAPCPQQLEPAAAARAELADVLDLAGYAEDAEHLRKPIRVGDVLLSHTVAVAAMLSFARKHSFEDELKDMKRLADLEAAL